MKYLPYIGCMCMFIYHTHAMPKEYTSVAFAVIWFILGLYCLEKFK